MRIAPFSYVVLEGVDSFYYMVQNRNHSTTALKERCDTHRIRTSRTLYFYVPIISNDYVLREYFNSTTFLPSFIHFLWPLVTFARWCWPTTALCGPWGWGNMTEMLVFLL